MQIGKDMQDVAHRSQAKHLEKMLNRELQVLYPSAQEVIFLYSAQNVFIMVQYAWLMSLQRETKILYFDMRELIFLQSEHILFPRIHPMLIFL